MSAQRAARKKKRRVNLARFLPAMAVMLAAVGLLGYFAGRALEKRTYPIAYAPEVRTGASEYALDPYLVLAVIHTESRGNAAAVSPKGAVGLMQIMPATGSWIAEKLDLADYTQEALSNADLNIRMGCWYLRYLLDKYENETSALAAYNAGPGNVDKWLGDERYSKDGALTEIPFQETANYVVRVRSAYAKYTELYHGELEN